MFEVGTILGIDVGLIPSSQSVVVIRVRASMGMGYVFVSFRLSFEIVYGLELGILIGIMFRLDGPDDVYEQTADVVHIFFRVFCFSVH